MILAVLVLISGILRIIDVFYEQEIAIGKRLFEFVLGSLLVGFSFMIYFFSTFVETVLLTILDIAVLIQGLDRISLALTHVAYPFWIKLSLIVIGFISIVIGISAAIPLLASYDFTITVVDLLIVAFIANGISLLLQGIIGLRKTKRV